MKDYKQFMEKMIKAVKKLVVCTHGKSGATALTSEGKWIEEGIVEKYKRVDTNGAGDAFFTGFLYWHSWKKCKRVHEIWCINSRNVCDFKRAVRRRAEL